MRNKNFVLLDKSGSMSGMWSDTIGGLNSYVKNVPDADVMVAAFDSEGYNVVRNGSSDDWKDITTSEIVPGGGTPLLDASGRIIWNMIDSKAPRAILVVITDGEENLSTKFRTEEIKNMTKYITEKLDYELVFLGANFDKVGDVALNSYGLYDTSRSMATSARGFASATASSASGTINYFSSGKSAQFYNEADKLSAKV